MSLGEGVVLFVEVDEAVREGWPTVDVEVFRVQHECSLRWQQAGKSRFNRPTSHDVCTDGSDTEKWKEGGVCNAVATHQAQRHVEKPCLSRRPGKDKMYSWLQ